MCVEFPDQMKNLTCFQRIKFLYSMCQIYSPFLRVCLGPLNGFGWVFHGVTIDTYSEIADFLDHICNRSCDSQTFLGNLSWDNLDTWPNQLSWDLSIPISSGSIFRNWLIWQLRTVSTRIVTPWTICKQPDSAACTLDNFNSLPNIMARVSQTVPSTPFGGHGAVLWGPEQRPSLGSFAVILHNPSVTIYSIKYSPVELRRGPPLIKV